MEFGFSFSGQWFLWLMLLCITGSLLAHLFAYQQSKAADNWHGVKAQVLEVFIKTRTADDEEEHAPHVKYSYRFKGRTFIKKRVKFGQLWSADYFLSADLIAPIRINQEIQVLINPHSPNQSTVYSGYHGHILYHVFGHLACLSVVVYLLLK